jgi:Fe-S oxidoreductase
MPRLANRMTRLPGIRSLALWAAGVDARRSVPAFASRTFRSWFSAQPVVTTGKPVVLFVDSFTNHFSPSVAQAAVAVLRSAGYAPAITSENACCGLTWISTGQLDHARKILRRTVDAIPDSAAPIVVLEPSCAASLREELPQLLADDPRAGRLASRVVSLAQILRGSSQGFDLAGQFDLSGQEVNLQPHCHQRSGWGFADDVAVLTAAGATISKTIDGCCGLAGNFGMERGHEEESEKVAALHLLPALENAAPGSALVADGYSCRTQVHDLAPAHRPLHLAQLLAQGLKKEKVQR